MFVLIFYLDMEADPSSNTDPATTQMNTGTDPSGSETLIVAVQFLLILLIRTYR